MSLDGMGFDHTETDMEHTGWNDDRVPACAIDDLEWIVEGELLAALGATARPRERQRGALRLLTMSLCLLVLGALAGRIAEFVFGNGVPALAVGLWAALNGTILFDALVMTWIRQARRRGRTSRRLQR